MWIFLLQLLLHNFWYGPYVYFFTIAYHDDSSYHD